MFKVTVLYPKDVTDNFDLDYFLNTHTPLLHQLLASDGLIKVEIEEGVAGGAPGTDPGYIIICGLFFPDLDTLENAMGKHAMDLIGDIPNFTGVVPEMQVSHIL